MNFESRKLLQVQVSDRTRRVTAEFLATFTFIAIGVGSVAAVLYESVSPPVLIISLGHGLGIIIGAITFGGISGAHMNPAVTVAKCLTKAISITEAIMYIAAQLLAAILAYVIILGLTNFGDADSQNLGVHGTLGTGVNAFEGLAIEILVTFVLVIVVLVTTADKRNPYLAPFAIGLTILGTHLFALPFTGASLNPARSFAPSLINFEWDNHWIFWLGPIVGSITAVIIYSLLFGRKHADK